MTAKTMFEKIWDAHIVHEEEGQPSLIYIDLHLVHEVTSPQAFEGLRMSGRKVRRPDLTVATMDHNTPTWDLSQPILDPIAISQLDYLERNCKEFGVTLYDRFSPLQGIVHIIGPEQGHTQPGKTIVCGDSHTSTHGAFGAFATMEGRIDGPLPNGVSAKDVILAIIGKIGIAGATGHVIEYTGEGIRQLSMEGRMTVCNMSIEGGGRAGMVAPDDTTFEYMRGRANVPQGADFDKAIEEWHALATDEGAVFDKVVIIPASEIEPHVSWGTNPGMVAPVTGRVPNPDSYDDEGDRESVGRALDYMGLEPDTRIEDITLDRVFIGSCTNGRIEDIRAAAAVAEGKKVADSVYAMVVPGSAAIKAQAEDEGLDKILTGAGFAWRVAGCSMCLGMNPDILDPGERCASTSNRNFEGRQGKGGRTHLVSPEMAAASAIAGHFVDIREW